ncbi:hypothetical protein BGX34_009222, partial [Mortierella sp. NVP85]
DQLASASDDTTARLWNIESGLCRLILNGHRDWVYCVVYSLEGDLLVSGSQDKMVRIWDTASGQCRAAMQDFPDTISAVDWNSTLGGNYLVTGCYDGSVLKWQVIEETGLCRVQLCWSATNGALNMTGASIQGVRGLTHINEELLKQRGAVGEPDCLISMLSRHEQSSDGVIQDSSTVAYLPDVG